MTLVLNEEQLMLRDAAAGFLGDRATVAQLRALRDREDETGYDPADRKSTRLNSSHYS